MYFFGCVFCMQIHVYTGWPLHRKSYFDQTSNFQALKVYSQNMKDYTNTLSFLFNSQAAKLNDKNCKFSDILYHLIEHILCVFILLKQRTV